MKKKLSTFLGGIFFVALVFQGISSYAQEMQGTLVVIPQASNQLSYSLVERQKEIDLAKIRALSERDLAHLYATSSNRSLDENHSRTMTNEVQRACSEVERQYTVNFESVSASSILTLWDFGDNTEETVIPITRFQTSMTTPYTYTTPGTYTIVVQFVDSSFNPTSDPTQRIQVMVEVCLPPAAPGIPVNPNVHLINQQ
ncbi:PKD domain-containing protein [Myroides sp. DW712]|uniref:PKD domain-containing protein n=1 Tax=Myroides sp. DW712 TaxID=3389800 RepID=UPI00397AF9DB